MHLSYLSVTLSVLLTSFTASAYSEHGSVLARRAVLEDAYTSGYVDGLRRRSLERRLDGKDPGGSLLHKIAYTPFPSFMQKGNTNPTNSPSVQSGDKRLDPKPVGFRETLVPGTKESNPKPLKDQRGGWLGNDEHSGDSRKAGSGQWMAPSKQQIEKNTGKLFDNMPSRETNTNKEHVSSSSSSGSASGAGMKGAAQKVMTANKAVNAFKAGTAGKKAKRSLYEDYEYDFDY